MLFITHDLPVLAEIADRTAVMYLGKIVEIADAWKIFYEPKHPYTKALLELSRCQILRSPERKSISLKSINVPSLLKPIPGCEFHTRCPYATEDCEKIKPELRLIGNRWIACHSP